MKVNTGDQLVPVLCSSIQAILAGHSALMDTCEPDQFFRNKANSVILLIGSIANGLLFCSPPVTSENPFETKTFKAALLVLATFGMMGGFNLCHRMAYHEDSNAVESFLTSAASTVGLVVSCSFFAIIAQQVACLTGSAIRSLIEPDDLD